jgi:threonine dehydrogenase-like Zn-dependent dehydrogenase
VKAFRIVARRMTEIVGIPQAKPDAGVVLLKVELAGYSGSDLSTYAARTPWSPCPASPATILGCRTDVPAE